MQQVQTYKKNVARIVQGDIQNLPNQVTPKSPMMSFTAKETHPDVGFTQLSHVSIFPQSGAVLQSFLESHVLDLFKDYKAVIL